MFAKLRHKYPGAISGRSETVRGTEYLWIQDDSGQILGIPSKQITKEEAGLLLTLFTVPTEANFNLSHSQRLWHAYLHDEACLPVTSWQMIRFIHLHLSNDDFSLSDFEEAITSLVSDDSILVWTDSMRGVLIQHLSEDSLGTSELFQLLDTLESDFYVRLRLFSGTSHYVENSLRQHFDYEREIFETCAGKLPSAKILDLPRAFPYMLSMGIPENIKVWYINVLIGRVLDDDELISTVKTYIECGSNASHAAKQLYIHRNSLQYRIDKFTERTGLDIRSFDHALTAYLLILISSAV
ncbi:PucR family transcriptional regulator [Peribacillus saganii]|nr:helix-turn-helix domain-containing protein [Peribacillus saganii]